MLSKHKMWDVNLQKNHKMLVFLKERGESPKQRPRRTNAPGPSSGYPFLSRRASSMAASAAASSGIMAIMAGS